MRHFIAKLICLVAAVTILEVPSVALQSYAWATMLNDRIPAQGLSEAISSTFDGEHPCEHCLTVQELQSDEKSTDDKTPAPQFQLGSIKLIGLSSNRIVPPSGSAASLLPHEVTDAHLSWRFYDSVPTPPPRLG